MSLLIFVQDDDTTCSLALSSQGSNTDLDPLTDSLVELGFDFSDAGAGGHRSNMTGQQRHHLQRQAQPSPLATTSARAPAQSSRGKLRCSKQIAFPHALSDLSSCQLYYLIPSTCCKLCIHVYNEHALLP